MFAKKKLLTAILPETAETAVVDALVPITHGVSVVSARGRGQHGKRPNAWHTGNVQVEAVLDGADVERAIAALEKFRATPMVAWISDVEAWPGEKFV